MRIISANVSQGFVYASGLKSSEGMIFRKFSIPDYVQYFKRNNPDILCLCEILIDDANGNSEFAETLSAECELPYYKVLKTETSWLYVGRYYGTAILSKYPIEDYEFFKLPNNPRFEINKPNGDHWILHDYYAQFARLNINNKKLNLFNLHYFPVHHFNHKLSDPEMKPSREALVEYLESKGNSNPTVITGDFNNKNDKLDSVFPELFNLGGLKECIETETSIVDGAAQLDHILYSPASLELKKGYAEKYLSDHYALIADISFA
jgi:endonuclease/exonuclease/phosphatase family metal-dependent hydrolase